jgi:UDP-2-acetamido-2-deoxy-ribo-hexuluronate aminotransferase
MGHSIKMVDLHGQYLKIKDEIDHAIHEVIDASAFINGKPVEAFANELADYTGSKYVIPCANGTDALQIAYQALDLKAGDEVLMPAFNYVASAEAASLLGLKPVFVDVWSKTFNINENLIKERITPATKAIVVVHLFGQSANMAPILEIANQFGLKVIEDNAQSLGSEYTFPNGEKKMTGTMGDINTYSFFPTKNLGCFGDGGALSTNNPDLAQKATMISRHGQGQKYAYDVVGCNSRLDTIQAAILRVKLRNISTYLNSRIEGGHHYNQLLESVPQVIQPSENTWSKHTYNQYVIRLKRRDKVKELLKAAGVPTMVYYPSPLHLQKAYAYLNNKAGDFPVAEELCREVLALPIHSEIVVEEQRFIVNSIIKSINSL